MDQMVFTETFHSRKMDAVNPFSLKFRSLAYRPVTMDSMFMKKEIYQMDVQALEATTIQKR